MFNFFRSLLGDLKKTVKEFRAWLTAAKAAGQPAQNQNRVVRAWTALTDLLRQWQYERERTKTERAERLARIRGQQYLEKIAAEAAADVRRAKAERVREETRQAKTAAKAADWARRRAIFFRGLTAFRAWTRECFSDIWTRITSGLRWLNHRSADPAYSWRSIAPVTVSAILFGLFGVYMLGFSENRYRIALGLLAIFMLAETLILRRWLRSQDAPYDYDDDDEEGTERLARRVQSLLAFGSLCTVAIIGTAMLVGIWLRVPIIWAGLIWPLVLVLRARSYYRQNPQSRKFWRMPLAQGTALWLAICATATFRHFAG